MTEDANNGNDQPDNAGVAAPPPLIFGVPLVATLLLNRRSRPRKKSSKPEASGTRRFLGWLLVAGGLLMLIWTERTMRRAGATINPYTATENLTTDGPFEHTRNPAYMSMAMIYCGVTVLKDSLPSALALPVVVGMMNRGVIEREEEYLERLFGGEYVAYKAQVGRWI